MDNFTYKCSNRLIKVSLLITGAIALSSNGAVAQIIPDATLGAETSTVTPNLVINGISSDRLDNGAIRNANLFHSFQEFNINAGRGAYFTNPAGIENILTRVTGTNPSNILGQLGVLGNANLYLLNPNGIIFGQNASLDVKGSFLATTASSINFADGSQFSAINPQLTPILTVSTPIGLGFGSNPGAIRVQGTGHDFTVKDPIFSPINRSSASNNGLQVLPGKTLALVGGNISLEGGTLTAEGGRIELGSVSSGEVSLNPTTSGWNLSYQGASSFQDIQLSQKAIANASGFSGGSIGVQGRNVSITDGSIIFIQNRGLQPAGNINLNASDSLEIIGTAADGIFRSGLVNQTLGLGNAGNVNVSTQRLLIKNGATISSETYSTAKGGNVNVNASESIQLIAFSPIVTSAASKISTSAYSLGNAGNVTISTKQLTALSGGFVSSGTFGNGSSGDVTVNATDSIELIGVEPDRFGGSRLAASTLSFGNAGRLVVNTSKLILRDGGTVASSTNASGNAGSIIVNATESVQVSGTVPGSINPSQIVSSAYTLDLALQRLLRLPPVPSGEAGDVIINTPQLTVSDRALVSVRNDGAGRAGTLQINAQSIVVDNLGSITAATKSGGGGNITLQAEDIRLRHNSQIVATAGGNGNGGNILINTKTLTALENSDITANAFQGRGGNIQINAQGIFRSADSDITASSQRGINGIVEVRTLGFDVNNILNPLSTNFVNPDRVVASSCLANRPAEQGKFTVTGTGGLPTTPYETLSQRYNVTQVQPIQGNRSRLSSANQVEKAVVWKIGDPIVEAQGLVRSASGRTVLETTSQNAIASAPHLICHSNHQVQ